MLNEFREFIAKGNVMDLAVGVIIGAAFQRIVDSLVNDLVMPVVGLATGGTDFSNMFTVLRDGAKVAAIPDPGVGSVPDGESRQPHQAAAAVSLMWPMW